MNYSINSHTRNKLRVVVVISALLVLGLSLALAAGCGTDPAGLEPLVAARGPVLAGRVSANGGPLAAATVRLEPVTGGLPASVAAILERARAGAAAAADNGASVAGGDNADGDNGGGDKSGEIRVAATDAEGRFVFTDVVPGQYLLTADGRHHLAGSAPATIADPATTAAETTFVDIALMPTGTIGGRALLATESLHAGTVVYVEGTSVVAVTRGDGEYALRDVPVGLRDVKAMRDGYRAAATTVTLAAAGDSARAADLVLGIDSNLPPVVAIQGPSLVDIYSSIALDATASDPDGTIVRYQWDFEDDGIFDTSSATTAFVSHWYQNEGVHRPKLRVTDDRGAVSYAVLRIDAVAAVYVAPSGNDGNAGTRTAPVATIDRAYQLAANLSETIGLRLAAGSYAPPTALLNHALTGGFEPATWTRTAGSRSVLVMGGSTLVASGLSETSFTGIEVRATEPGADGNSIAMLVTASSDVSFGDCRFVAVAGLPGVAGVNGAPGLWLPGQPGQTFTSCPSGNCTIEGGITQVPNVGWGGRGGKSSYAAAAGTAGTGGASGGAAGWLNTDTVPPTAGQSGGNAAPGSAASGAHGTAAAWPGSFSGSVWQAGHGSEGGDGQTSVGGGGGGGGGGSSGFPGYFTYWGGGGGAGGVSTGGAGGHGGRAGGSSFAVVTVLAANSFVSFSDCEFVSGSAGNGGVGGDGGASAPPALGGAGGVGMPFLGEEWNGRDGGSGGSSAASGSGGGGGGGAGGLSYAVYVTGLQEPTFTGSTYQSGAAGSGGLGGLRGGTASRAPSGPNGSAGAVYDDVQ